MTIQTRVETAHKRFNEQTNLIGGKGCVVANTFFKWDIKFSTMNEGIELIRDGFGASEHVIFKVKYYLVEYGMVYYAALFHTYKPILSPSDTRMVHGHFILNMDEKLLYVNTTRNSSKSQDIVIKCIPLIAPEGWAHDN